MATTLLTSMAYGLPVGLRIACDGVDEARTWLPWWWQDEAVDPVRTWEAGSAAACEFVVKELELWVAEHAEDQIFVHAGVVYVDGGAILLPGRSHAGKSTLVAALVAQGARYGSDEYAVLSPDGLVHPYPRPISLRQPDGTRRRVVVASAQVGEAAPVRLVAHLTYAAETTPALDPLVASQSVLRLLDNTVAAQTRTDEALDVLAVTAGAAPAVVGSRTDAATTAVSLLAFVATPGA